MSLQTQFVKFALVGGLATALQPRSNQSTRSASNQTLGTARSSLRGKCPRVLAAINITFRSQRRHLEAAPRFAVVAVVGFWINAGVVWLAFNAAGLHYLVA